MTDEMVVSVDVVGHGYVLPVGGSAPDVTSDASRERMHRGAVV